MSDDEHLCLLCSTIAALFVIPVLASFDNLWVDHRHYCIVHDNSWSHSCPAFSVTMAPGRQSKCVSQLGHVKSSKSCTRHYARITNSTTKKSICGPRRDTIHEAELDLKHVLQTATSRGEAYIMLAELGDARPPSTEIVTSIAGSQPDMEHSPATLLEPPLLSDTKDECAITPTKPHGTSKPSSARKLPQTQKRATPLRPLRKNDKAANSYQKFLQANWHSSCNKDAVHNFKSNMAHLSQQWRETKGEMQ